MSTYSNTFYLIVRPSGKYSGLNARITKNQNGLLKDERAIKIRVELPQSLFKQPQLEASFVIPEGQVNPAVISVDVQENIREIIKQQMGIDLTINLVEPKNTED